MTTKVLVLGAGSAMVRAAIQHMARRGDHLFLAGHDSIELSRIAADAEVRWGARVAVGRFDAQHPEGHRTLFDEVLANLGGLDRVLVASGYLGPDPRALVGEEPGRIVTLNFTGLLPILGLCAEHLERQRSGVLLGIGSVAGDRGRQSNFVYGAAKGGFALWLEGLSHRLHSTGVRVVTFKPGFVDTGMTYGKAGVFLVASQEAAGRALVKAMDCANGVVYFPGFWKGLMWVIRSLPVAVFLRTKL